MGADKTLRVVVKGGGDLASGVAWRLWRCGFLVAVTEVERPTCIRRAVAFAEAVWEGETTVEGVKARRASGPAGVEAAWQAGVLPVVVDPLASLVGNIAPDVVVDAILAKRNLGTRITDAPLVVGLGPGFVAGVDAHAVIETMRGHSLGRVIWEGQALPNTGIPGPVGGHTERRVIRAPSSGTFRARRAIGDLVAEGEVVADADGDSVCTRLAGVLRGILHDGIQVHQGMKVGDVDPRGVREHCFTVSDKALAIAGGVLEAVLSKMRGE